MSEEGKSRGVTFDGENVNPSAPPPPQLPNYYGTFQGVANYYQPPPPQHHHQQPQHTIGIPQPIPPPGSQGNHLHYYSHGYQTVPGYAVAHGRPVLDHRLPCCGCGIGWILFITGFIFGAIPWYIGVFILLCVRVDYREKPGLVACTIAAILAIIAVTLGFTNAAYSLWWW